MAFPVVEGVTGGAEDAANVESHTIELPVSSSDQRLIIFWTVDGAPSNIAWPSTDYIQVYAASNGTAVTQQCYYLDTVGTESTAIEVTHDAPGQRSSHTTYLISGQHSVAPEAAVSAATGASTAPDPPALDWSWGSGEDTLLLAASGADGSRAASSYPTNYTDGRSDNGASAGGTGTATARRELDSTGDDPGVFDIAASDQWVSQIVAIRPAGVGVAFAGHGLLLSGLRNKLTMVQ